MNTAAISDFPSIVAVFLASFLIWIMFAGVLALWVIDGRVKKEEALHAFFASILGWLIVQIVKDLIPTLRPFQINGFPPLTITVPGDGGFPSAHAALAFGLAVSIFLHNKKRGFIFLLTAVLVCLGRVISNVHYPLDVLGGAIIGSFTALLSDSLHLDYFIKKKA